MLSDVLTGQLLNNITSILINASEAEFIPNTNYIMIDNTMAQENPQIVRVDLSTANGSFVTKTNDPQGLQTNDKQARFVRYLGIGSIYCAYMDLFSNTIKFFNYETMLDSSVYISNADLNQYQSTFDSASNGQYSFLLVADTDYISIFQVPLNLSSIPTVQWKYAISVTVDKAYFIDYNQTLVVFYDNSNIIYVIDISTAIQICSIKMSKDINYLQVNNNRILVQMSNHESLFIQKDTCLQELDVYQDAYLTQVVPVNITNSGLIAIVSDQSMTLVSIQLLCNQAQYPYYDLSSDNGTCLAQCASCAQQSFYSQYFACGAIMCQNEVQSSNQSDTQNGSQQNQSQNIQNQTIALTQYSQINFMDLEVSRIIVSATATSLTFNTILLLYIWHYKQQQSSQKSDVNLNEAQQDEQGQSIINQSSSQYPLQENILFEQFPIQQIGNQPSISQIPNSLNIFSKNYSSYYQLISKRIYQQSVIENKNNSNIKNDQMSNKNSNIQFKQLQKKTQSVQLQLQPITVKIDSQEQISVFDTQEKIHPYKRYSIQQIAKQKNLLEKIIKESKIIRLIAKKYLTDEQNNPIGYDASGRVYSCKIGCSLYACKLIQKNLTQMKDIELIEFLRMIIDDISKMQFITKLGCESCLPIRGLFLNIKEINTLSIAIFTDLMGTDLFNYIQKNAQQEKSAIKHKQEVNILLQIARGLSILSEHKIIHGNLKPQNILLDDMLNAKISDFGIFKFKTHDIALASGDNFHVAPIYCPPELVALHQTNETTDIYSFGCLTLHLLTSKIPWHGLTPQEVVEFIKSSNVTVLQHYLAQEKKQQADRQNIQISQPLIKLIEQCTDREGRNRPTSKQVEKFIEYYYEKLI